jgi:hypothetical protein
METATARMIERKAFTVLKYSLLPARVRLPGGGANRHFQLQKRSQLFIRSHNETLSVAAMCVNDPDCSTVGINGCDVAQAPTHVS